MATYNTLSQRAIRTAQDRYLLTDQIPGGFDFSGKYRFTLGITFNLQAYLKNKKALLYGIDKKIGERQFFWVGLENDKLFFESWFTANIALPFEFKLDQWYTLHLTFSHDDRLEKRILTVYVNGEKISSTTTEDYKVVSIPTEKYSIGENFTGYIRSLYVYDALLNQNQILEKITRPPLDGQSPVPDLDENHLKLYYDFTGNIIEDSGPSRIGVFQGNPEAEVTLCNVSHVLDLSGHGYINFESSSGTINNNFSFILRFCPIHNDEITGVNYCILMARRFWKRMFRLCLKRDGNGYQVIFLINTGSGNEETLTSSTRIKAHTWTDIGVSIDGSKITLYQNGEIVCSVDDVKPLSLSYSQLNIGSDDGGRNYFYGYISHFCGFSRSLSESDFKSYLNNPPFVFSQKIQWLFYFADRITVERISGKEFRLNGNAVFSNIEGKASGADLPAQIEIDNTGSKLWNNYTPSQQWHIETAALIIQTSLEQLRFADTYGLLWYQEPVVAGYLYNTFVGSPDYTKLIEVDGAQESAKVIIINSLSVIISVAALFSCQSQIKRIIYSEAFKMAVGVVAAAAAVIISRTVTERSKQRPDEDGYSLKFRFITDAANPKTSSLNTTTDAKMSEEEKSDQDIACYVISKITNPIIEIEVTAINDVKNIVLQGKEDLSQSNGLSKLLGDFKTEAFDLKAGVPRKIRVELKDHALGKEGRKILIENTVWRVVVIKEDIKKFVRNKRQKVFTVLDTPQYPWELTGKKNRDKLPWTNILEIADVWINKNITKEAISPQLLLSQLTKNINEHGYSLNLQDGTPEYTDLIPEKKGEISIDLYRMDKDYREKKLPEYGINSLDCSYLLATLARLHGIPMNVTVLSAGQFLQGFHINDVMPIGLNKWENPYADKGTGFLNYHSVAVQESADGHWYNLKVYDPCFRLKNTQGAFLPVNLVMAKSTSGLTISEKTDRLTYRHYLVCEGEINAVSMPLTKTWQMSIKEKTDQL